MGQMPSVLETPTEKTSSLPVWTGVRDRDINIETWHRRSITVRQRKTATHSSRPSIRQSEDPGVPSSQILRNIRPCLQPGCGWFHTEMRAPLLSKLTSRRHSAARVRPTQSWLWSKLNKEER